MNPTEPNTANLAANWTPVTYAKNQPEYIPLPTLQERDPQERGKARAAALIMHANRVLEYARTLPCSSIAGCVHCSIVALADRAINESLTCTDSERVVSVWEPDDDEREALYWAAVKARDGTGPRPRVSLMLHTFGGPLQPVRLVVGDFTEPYADPLGVNSCPMDKA